MYCGSYQLGSPLIINELSRVALGLTFNVIGLPSIIQLALERCWSAVRVLGLMNMLSPPVPLPVTTSIWSFSLLSMALNMSVCVLQYGLSKVAYTGYLCV